MIGAAEIRAMKQGAYLINNSRGTVVDLDALAAALREGQAARRRHRRVPGRAGLECRKFRSPLQGLGKCHPDAACRRLDEEAQERIGVEVARKLIEYCDVGSTMGAVNFPQVQLPIRPLGTRFIQVQRNLPGMLGRLNDMFARHAINIAAQYSETHSDIGYVVLDADASATDSQRVLAEIRALEGTIRARLLYEHRG